MQVPGTGNLHSRVDAAADDSAARRRPRPPCNSEGVGAFNMG
ncbi:hypothetical protein ACFPRL_07535 [Pseudoclavibacter helvolus]